jgi:phosphatidate cytidylyltransferase
MAGSMRMAHRAMQSAADIMAEGTARWSDLTLRVASGLLMAGLALSAAWAGGLLFALFWIAAGIAVLHEWLAIVSGERRPAALACGGAAIALAGFSALEGFGGLTFLLLVVGSVALWAACRSGRQAGLATAGLPYAGAMAVPIILIRADQALGLVAVLFLFCVVWGCDVMAYFTGRALAGPKLWPRVSPKKTWSGFLGGTFFGAAAGTALCAATGVGRLAPIFVLGFVLAVASQGGDLFESALKRRFGAKDASRLIPGHGGVMDRLDGFVAAAVLAGLIGALRQPLSIAKGLLVW